MNPELPCHLMRSLLLSIEARGHDVGALLKELAFTPSAARTRISWEEVSQFLEGFAAREGAPATQALMQEFAGRLSAVRATTELLGSSRFTYLVLLEALHGRQPLLTVGWKVDDGALTLSLQLARGLRPSLLFFQCCAWFAAAIPRARGLPDAQVRLECLSERELSCVLVPPDDPPLLVAHAESQARTIARELFRPARNTPSALALQSRFGLTRAEAGVVRRLAEGESMKSIARSLDVSLETARTHAKRAMQKTDTHRQAELVSLVLRGR